jgi:hypothetical protein
MNASSINMDENEDYVDTQDRGQGKRFGKRDTSKEATVNGRPLRSDDRTEANESSVESYKTGKPANVQQTSKALKNALKNSDQRRKEHSAEDDRDSENNVRAPNEKSV